MVNRLYNVKVVDPDGRLLSESEDIPMKDLLPLVSEFTQRMDTNYVDPDDHGMWDDDCEIILTLTEDR